MTTVDFDLDDTQREWQARGASLGQTTPGEAGDAAGVVRDAARAGLFEPAVALAAQVAAIEALATVSSTAGVAVALHAAASSVVGDGPGADLRSGERVGALALSSDSLPEIHDGRVSGRAAWVAPVTLRGIAVVGARTVDGTLTACTVDLGHTGVAVHAMETAGLRGTSCADLTFDDVPASSAGPAVPVMIRARILISAAGIGIGRRALAEALAAARRDRSAAAWEQTVQGLLADAATELEAAAMLLWRAAARAAPTLGAASIAKLAVGLAAQRAVAHATQVIGADSFRRGHPVEALVQDVRAFELIAGRTESLREAAAAEILPEASG